MGSVQQHPCITEDWWGVAHEK